MHWNADPSHLEAILAEPVPCPADDVGALRLDEGQEAARDLDLSQEGLLGEVEGHDHVAPLEVIGQLFGLLRLP